MGQLLIRNLDDETIAAYREAAARNHRSLEAEVRRAIETLRPMTEAKVVQTLERFAAIRAMAPQVPQTPSEDLVREDRDGFREA